MMGISPHGENKESGYLLTDVLVALFLTAFSLSILLSGFSIASQHVRREKEIWFQEKQGDLENGTEAEESEDEAVDSPLDFRNIFIPIDLNEFDE